MSSVAELVEVLDPLRFWNGARELLPADAADASLLDLTRLHAIARGLLSLQTRLGEEIDALDRRLRAGARHVDLAPERTLIEGYLARSVIARRHLNAYTARAAAGVNEADDAAA
jgi:hypothetical protein